MYCFFATKFVVSFKKITSSDLTVIVIYESHRELSKCRSGDKVWFRINTWESVDCDVIYHKDNDKFYAINYHDRIKVFDVRCDNPNVGINVFAGFSSVF